MAENKKARWIFTSFSSEPQPRCGQELRLRRAERQITQFTRYIAFRNHQCKDVKIHLKM